MAVDLLSAAPSPELLADYHWCMGSNGPVHGNCVALNARAAFADPHEVAKQGGRYVVILPAGWEPLAAMTVADMAICLPRIEEYLGIALPGYASPLVWRYSESNGYSWFGAGAGIQQITPAAQDFYQGVLDGQFTQHSWESIFRGLCSEAHEPTHVTVDSAMGLPHWLTRAWRRTWATPTASAGTYRRTAVAPRPATTPTNWTAPRSSSPMSSGGGSRRP